MKYFISFIAVITLFNGLAMAQKKITQGKLTLSMSVPDSSSKNKELTTPDAMVVYFKDSLSRTEINTKAGNMIMIYNGRTGENITCMDMLGKKVAMRSTKEEINKKRERKMEEKPMVKLMNETKTIAGLKCRRAKITYSNKGRQAMTDTWYTNEITPVVMKDDALANIDGYALESTSYKNGTTVKILCTSFEKIKVSDTLFKIPAGYEETDMSKMMNGGKH